MSTPKRRRSSIITKLKTSPFKKSHSSYDISPNTPNTNSYSMQSPIFTPNSSTSSKQSYGFTTPTLTSSSSMSFQHYSSPDTVITETSPIPPKSSTKIHKNFNENKCCFCHDSLHLTLPGEVILELECEHTCHKDCFTLLIDKSNLKNLPICNICKLPTKIADNEIHQTIIENILSLSTENSFDEENPFLEPHTSNTSSISTTTTSIITPTFNRTESDIFSNESKSLFTLPQPTTKDSELYTPNISCISETSNVRLNENNEISYIFNIKPPMIYNDSSNQFNLSEYQLKTKISNHLKKKLQLNKELGELIIFDKLKISINGEIWDDSVIYLFKNYLLFYNDDNLAGMISIEEDLCSLNLSNDGVLNLNLSESSLPELYIYHQNSIIIEKWENILIQVLKQQDPLTNLFQFTSTCWIDLQNEFMIPQNLIRFNNSISCGGSISNLYITKLLPPPLNLPLNLVVALPLYNKSWMSNQDYKYWLQDFLYKILGSLRNNDKLSLILVGVDGNRSPCATGSFIGSIEANWDGWQDLINEISIIPNQFKSTNQEIQITLNKLNTLYPFLGNTESSINEVLIVNCGSYKEDVNESLKLDSHLRDNFSISVLKIGKYTESLNQLSLVSPFQYGNESIIRFEDYEEVLKSIESLIKEVYQKICIPNLKLSINTDEGIQISSIESNGSMIPINSSKQTIAIKNILPSTNKNILINFKIHNYHQFSDLKKVPILNYTTNYNNKSFRKQIYSKLDIIEQQQQIDIPITPSKSSSTTNTELFYLDIPLLPPLSPSRDTSFTFIKRQTELLILENLQKSINSQNSNHLKECISVAYGLVRSVSPVLQSTLEEEEDDDQDEELLEQDNYLSQLLILQKLSDDNNEKYINFIVKKLNKIIELFESDIECAIDKCYDLINSLI
ncbi:FAR1 [Candida jiufengensis]|uniref:FAR1 n=1 Tax=Candida jiufengensis TaxID=497108 RepID=UPI002223F549|nr:FAR1 [Candida jiufengensis]KAI5950121.1 FAR1 [Candida jiufengensis]